VSALVEVSRAPPAGWDAFVSRRPEASLYHGSGWILLVSELFGHEPAFIHARNDAGELTGVLPVVRQKSLLAGNFATSIPFFNYGGAVGESDATCLRLMERARELAQDWGCSYLELRDDRPRDGGWSVRTDKVAMVLDLPPSFDELARQLGSKLRSQVKRAERDDAVVSVGGAGLLDDFYDVFCRNMRDLGTPTYPRRFFAAILARFPDHCLLLSVRRAGVPVAAAFLLRNGTRAEIPWASCRTDAKPSGFNMKLYWEVLSTCIERGCSRFDFGRSTVDSGTFRFKKQWGARPVQLYWHRWDRQAQGADHAPGAGKAMRLASAVWQKLPLPVANRLGPLISPSLPW
jgi:FemAB-related protein (PEP-CTERM system-associated)